MRTNQTVETPIGTGVVQGIHTLQLQGGEVVNRSALVRLPINPVTSAHLKDGNCWTPGASRSGLWIFPMSEIKV